MCGEEQEQKEKHDIIKKDAQNKTTSQRQPNDKSALEKSRCPEVDYKCKFYIGKYL